jgi:hypothetical protein
MMDCRVKPGNDVERTDSKEGVEMIIDVHGHLVPPDLVAQIRKDHGRFPSLRLV